MRELRLVVPGCKDPFSALLQATALLDAGYQHAIHKFSNGFLAQIGSEASCHYCCRWVMVFCCQMAVCSCAMVHKKVRSCLMRVCQAQMHTFTIDCSCFTDCNLHVMTRWSRILLRTTVALQVLSMACSACVVGLLAALLKLDLLTRHLLQAAVQIVQTD